jgi:hypothetical protein
MTTATNAADETEAAEATGATGATRDASREPPSVTVRLDATDIDVREIGALAGQIPLASTLAPGTRVVVLDVATRKAGMLGRLLGHRRVSVPRAMRCTALLLRGYIEIGAGEEGAWGKAP